MGGGGGGGARGGHRNEGYTIKNQMGGGGKLRHCLLSLVAWVNSPFITRRVKVPVLGVGL